jgi:hypothetical protein
LKTIRTERPGKSTLRPDRIKVGYVVLVLAGGEKKAELGEFNIRHHFPLKTTWWESRRISGPTLAPTSCAGFCWAGLDAGELCRLGSCTKPADRSLHSRSGRRRKHGVTGTQLSNFDPDRRLQHRTLAA